MSTEQDLKQIKKLLSNVVTKKDLDRLATKDDVGTIKADVETIKKEVVTIKKDVVQVRKDIKTIINFFDADYLDLRKRLERIEEILKLPPIN